MIGSWRPIRLQATSIQQAMDVLHVVGNNALHPGEIRVEDDPEMVGALFQLLNLIVDDRIARPAQIAALYDALPEGTRQAVGRRDGEGLVTTS
jgi:hypothetical protein